MRRRDGWCFALCLCVRVRMCRQVLKSALTDHCLQWQFKLSSLLNRLARTELDALHKMFEACGGGEAGGGGQSFDSQRFDS